MAAAEIGRYCGSTALTWNMHVCSCLWTGALADQLDMTAEERRSHARRRAIHYKRVIEDGKIYSQPFSEGGAAAAGAVAFGTKAKKVDEGWLINGKKIFASLAGHADYYGVLCTEDRADATRRHTMFMAVPAQARGVEVAGDWDPLGMRGTVSRNLIFKDALIDDDEALMPTGIYYQGVMRWPHMFLTLTPAYIGLMQAAYDFTVKYLRGEVEGMPPVKRRMFPTKQIAVAQMRVMLEQTKVLWLQTMREARIDPSKDQRLRAYAAQYSAMENSNEMAQLAIRTCGGQSMLKIIAAGTHLPRLALRLADAAVDRRVVSRQSRPPDPVRAGGNRRMRRDERRRSRSLPRICRCEEEWHRSCGRTAEIPALHFVGGGSIQELASGTNGITSVRPEIVSLEKQRLGEHAGQCIGKAVAEVEAGGVTALAEPHERVTRCLRLLDVHRHDLDGSPLDEAVHHLEARRAVARLDHDRGLDERSRRDPPRVRNLDGFVETPSLGLVLEYGQQRRGVENH